MKLAAPALLIAWLLPGVAAGDESNWRTTWDATVYGYAARTHLNADSVLNPGNAVARADEGSETLEVRSGVRIENDTLRLTGRNTTSWRSARNAFGGTDEAETTFTQWQVRLRATDAWSISGGRDVMNWGAAQFRSPSSPFYFDNGRGNPLRELSGVDVVKVSWVGESQNSLQIAHVLGSGGANGGSWRKSWLVKYDHYGEEWSAGVLAVGSPDRATFVGFHGQYTVTDGLLAYAELSSDKRPDALQSPADTGLVFQVLRHAKRTAAGLIGAAYTLENGQTIIGEYLHDGQGYDAGQLRGYFARAVRQPGLALGLAPRLLGQDYVHLVWHSNVMESGGFWRLMMTRNLTDGSTGVSGYGEVSLSNGFSVFGLGAVNGGNPREDLSALFTRSVLVGVKVAL